MPRTLYAKIALVLVLLMAAVGLLYAFVSTSATRHYLQAANQRFNRDLARNLVADRNLVEEGRLNREALKETFHQYMVINPSIEIYLLDRDGVILSYSADPGKVKRKRVALAPIRAFLDGARAYPLLGDDPRSHDRRKAFSVTPVPSADRPEGYLYVVLRGEQVEAVEQAIRDSHLVRMSGWAVAGSLLVGLLAGLLVFRLLTRRLHRLAGVMDAFADSGFSAHWAYGAQAPGRGDEVERLGATFDRMAERMGAQLERLEAAAAQRRELVAQVSHDLRTPLATLHGYLESLELGERTLSPAQREEYLAIALRQSRRLGTLVGELFELSTLDARDCPPNREPFPVAELIQDVVQKFQLEARRQGVTLTLEPVPELPFVNADIGLIERLAENLIHNALRHTPKGGRVRVALALEEGGETARVRVTDSGKGIPEGDLAHLFEPFFRGAGRRTDHLGAGLGLAIAKRIVVLHGGRIEARNPPQGGAAFTFILPIR